MHVLLPLVPGGDKESNAEPILAQAKASNGYMQKRACLAGTVLCIPLHASALWKSAHQLFYTSIIDTVMQVVVVSAGCIFYQAGCSGRSDEAIAGQCSTDWSCPSP